ncbi:hypothetical protein [Deinococcus metallilatus]|uniref:Uncharacterized protein n=1 Tax=Deinococcus metallilatus TaxID=1211322 RepID=A0ABR6MU25_9DEIO|nr:hypothetical protein [Deinococcus metallilatus]MBB5295425.1 hypothetical protein [Deinococcus metallilatus]GMA16102.1 hypothetical protein GCM10025871_24330 [Deinococcus metallilatus]
MPKKIVKVLAVLAVFGFSLAQAGANDYGILKSAQTPAPQGANDYGILGTSTSSTR